MFKRSKITIDVDSIHSGSDTAPCHLFERPRQLSSARADHAPRRTAPFPNGDDLVTDGLLTTF
jgi:hypothetical protein